MSDSAPGAGLPPPAVALQYLLPKQALTRLAGWLAARRGGAATTAVIRAFIRRYGVDMREAAESEPAAYPTFNAFFTRALKPGLRPLAGAHWVCPADGTLSQLGRITGGEIFQAKGRHYSAHALLGSADWAEPFANGHFATVYLSPRDYHRLHMPAAGRLTAMRYIPGALFSVNPQTAAHMPGLFARNERVVCLFDTAHGPMALVLVGATIVGSIATTWAGTVCPPRPGRVVDWAYAQDEAPRFAQGAEFARFALGSTIVCLHGAAALAFDAACTPGASVRMGQALVASARAAHERQPGVQPG